jgi:hypothetical protein
VSQQTPPGGPYQQPAPQQPGPQQPGGQQQYAQPVYQQTVVYAAYQPQPKGLSITALVLGLASILFGFTLLVPVGAVVFGIIGIRREPSARGMSITGVVLGGICLLGWLLLVVLWIVFAIILAGAAATSYSGSYVS